MKTIGRRHRQPLESWAVQLLIRLVIPFLLVKETARNSNEPSSKNNPYRVISNLNLTRYIHILTKQLNQVISENLYVKKLSKFVKTTWVLKIPVIFPKCDDRNVIYIQHHCLKFSRINLTPNCAFSSIRTKQWKIMWNASAIIPARFARIFFLYSYKFQPWTARIFSKKIKVWLGVYCIHKVITFLETNVQC